MVQLLGYILLALIVSNELTNELRFDHDPIQIISCTSYPCDALTIEVKSNCMRVGPDGIVLAKSPQFDSVLFALINAYRDTYHLPELAKSDRLDSLALKVNYWNQRNGTLNHYSSIPQMSPHRDLLNAENIYYNVMSNTSDIFTPQNILDTWTKSELHNKNLLITDLSIGAASVLLKASCYRGDVIVELFATFEIDSERSKRDMTENFNRANKQKWDTLKKRKQKQ